MKEDRRHQRRWLMDVVTLILMLHVCRNLHASCCLATTLPTRKLPVKCTYVGSIWSKFWSSGRSATWSRTGRLYCCSKYVHQSWVFGLRPFAILALPPIHQLLTQFAAGLGHRLENSVAGCCIPAHCTRLRSSASWPVNWRGTKMLLMRNPPLPRHPPAPLPPRRPVPALHKQLTSAQSTAPW